MELLPGCRQQIGAVTLMGELHYIQKTCTSINITHIFSLLVAFPAALTSSKAMREDWVGGAAVWLTAAAVPSRKFENSNARSMRCTTLLPRLQVFWQVYGLNLAKNLGYL